MNRRTESPPRAWVLNLDAEHELEALLIYAPTDRMRANVVRESRRLIGPLVAEHDVVVTEEELARGGELADHAHGLEGLAWCPTPRARKLLAAAGARVAESPTLAVLRTVNARSFAAAVRAPLALSSFAKHVATDADTVLARLAQPAGLGWLVRRTFGAAGRGRRRIAAGRPSTAEIAWIQAGLRFGPLVIEPWVEVLREHTRSGWVGRDGAVSISVPCFQEVNAYGAWTDTARAPVEDVDARDDACLEAACAAAGAALAAAGYFGPFGIDAFHHRAPDAAGVALNPLSEINARFTMDWATAMGADPGFGRDSDAARARLDDLALRTNHTLPAGTCDCPSQSLSRIGRMNAVPFGLPILRIEDGAQRALLTPGITPS